MKKKSEIVWGINYDLNRFQKDFIEATTYCPKSDLHDRWYHAIVLFMAVYESMNGKYPNYNCPFMQALAMCDLCDYYFDNDFRLDGEDIDSYALRRDIAVGYNNRGGQRNE